MGMCPAGFKGGASSNLLKNAAHKEHKTLYLLAVPTGICESHDWREDVGSYDVGPTVDLMNIDMRVGS